MPNKYQQAIVVITKEQEKIIGKNLSIQLIKGVNNLKIDSGGTPVLEENANPKEVLEKLVEQYATIFGRASIEVAKDAIENLDEPLLPNDLPDNLK